MPKIVDERAYDGAMAKIDRLGLAPLVEEIRRLITGFDLRIEERRHSNGAGAVREMLDRQFQEAGGWVNKKSGGIDWQKCLSLNDAGARACIGVELQVSARSDLLSNDLLHLMTAVENGFIDIGVIVVPANETAYFLTDRCPSFKSAVDHVARAKGQFSPILIYSIGHDGVGEALLKKRTNLGRI